MSIPIAQILYINNYRCRRCRHEFATPNPKLLYLYKNPKTGKPKMIPEGRSWRGLPREIRQSPFSSVQACEYCFDNNSLQPQGELELKDDLAPEVHGVQATPLSMF